MASYNVEILPRVRKDFHKIPKSDVLKVLAEIQALAEVPRPTSAKKLKGDELYRIRIGVYRVIYEIFDNRLVVSVVKVSHRKDV